MSNKIQIVKKIHFIKKRSHNTTMADGKRNISSRKGSPQRLNRILSNSWEQKERQKRGTRKK